MHASSAQAQSFLHSTHLAVRTDDPDEHHHGVLLVVLSSLLVHAKAKNEAKSELFCKVVDVDVCDSSIRLES